MDTQSKIRIYLDWNIITNLRTCYEDERVDPRFKVIKSLIDDLDGHLVLPFSNAHITDIISNYNKGERIRVKLSLEYLSLLSKDICICLYSNEKKPLLHYRKPNELFEDLISEENSIMSFEEVVAAIKSGKDGAKRIQAFEKNPHTINMKAFKKQSPFLASLFPNSCNDKSQLAFLKDFINLSNDFQSNPLLYMELRRIFRDGTKISKHVSTLTNSMAELNKLFSTSLLNRSFIEIYEENNPKEYTKAKVQSRLTGLYMQLDLVGFNSDKLSEKNKYGNLFNDALHCYYAAHFDFYVTNDKRGAKKSKAVYESEGITTKVLNIDEFIALLKDLKEKLPVKAEILLPHITEMNWIKKVFQKWIYRRKSIINETPIDLREFHQHHIKGRNG